MPNKQVYLITGSTGFIGSHLLRRLLANNEKVHIILRKEALIWRIKDLMNKVTCHISDLSDAASLKKIILKIKPTIIYHLATHGAYAYQDQADKIIHTNILGTWNLLKSVSVVDYKLFVNTGSSSEYGFKKAAMRETDSIEPASYYAVTKCSQSLLCEHVAREEKRPIVTIRPFSVYGPYEESTRFIPTLIKALYFKKRINLVSPDISRDLIYIDDVIDAYMSVNQLKRFAGEIFNIGTGVQSSIRDVVETAVRVTGRTTKFEWGKMKKRIWDTNSWVADISKARSLLGWTPRISLEKGLCLMWKWFQTSVFDETN